MVQWVLPCRVVRGHLVHLEWKIIILIARAVEEVQWLASLPRRRKVLGSIPAAFNLFHENLHS